MSTFDGPRPRLSKADWVYGELRRQLVQGERAFGETFSSYDLAEEFGVSRRPVMDAIMRLQGDGFVEIESQVGCRVVAPSTEDVLEHIEYTQALHGFSAMLAALRASPEDKAAVEAAYAALEEAVRGGDTETYDKLNYAFHDAIVHASGNRRLETLCARAWDMTRFFAYLRDPRDLPTLQREHRRILDAIAAGDGDAARKAMEAHQRHAFERVGGEQHVPAAGGGRARAGDRPG